jgi:exocyst complex component 3
MNEFQAAERHQLEEPAADIGLEPLCAMVCTFPVESMSLD